MNIKALKPEEVNKMIVLYDEITSLIKQGLLYRKVFLIDSDCPNRKACGGDCDVCPANTLSVTESIIKFSEFDKSKHYSSQEDAEAALVELEKKKEPTYEKIRQNPPKQIVWRGQGHESYTYCPTCGEFLGEEPDLSWEPVDRCPRCGQALLEE